MSGRAWLTARALASNAVNLVSKDLHSALRRATGRGGDASTPEAAAAYVRGCFDDYLERLGVAGGDAAGFLRDRTVLEYGPGDLPGVSLLMVAHGARSATCADRFPWLRLSEANRQALAILAQGLPPLQRERLAACFAGEGMTGPLRPESVRYVVSADGLSSLSAEVDLAISRSVLEHVNRLDLTLADMACALRPGGRACHKVDLRSHGFEWGHPLDFLTVSPLAWRLMSSHNGSMPNRLRVSDFRRELAGLPLADVAIEPTHLLEPGEAEAIRPRLAAPFRKRSVEDLRTLGFWLTARRA